MKKVTVVLALLLAVGVFVFVGYNRTGTVSLPSPKVSAPPAGVPLARERTYEERRQAASEAVNGRKNEVTDNTVRVDLTSLSGKRGGGLYAKYLGMTPGPFPPSIVVSFDERMAAMYHQKVNFRRCKRDKKGKELSCAVASDTVLEQAPDILDRYLEGDKQKMDIHVFMQQAEAAVSRAKTALSWVDLCRKAYQLNPDKCQLLQNIMYNVHGNDLAAYGSAELFPSADGEFNVKYLDALLKNAGAEFLHHVPSLGDRFASLGFYQFTFFALRDDEERVEGVSIVNKYVAEGERLPGSVVKLIGDQHHTAAFYFAVHNMAHILRKLDASHIETLKKVHGSHRAEMVVAIACAHHHPGGTFPVVKRWLEAKAKFEQSKKQLATPKKGSKKVKPVEDPNFVSMFPRLADLNQYATKSWNNRRAIYAMK